MKSLVGSLAHLTMFTLLYIACIICFDLLNESASIQPNKKTEKCFAIKILRKVRDK